MLWIGVIVDSGVLVGVGATVETPSNISPCCWAGGLVSCGGSVVGVEVTSSGVVVGVISSVGVGVSVVVGLGATVAVGSGVGVSVGVASGVMVSVGVGSPV